jgi:CHAD domain-containing protein
MRESAQRSSLFQQRLDAFTRRLGLIHEGDLQAVHSTRVASRRLRELLPILELDADTTRNLGRRLRHVTRRLGVVRELDVLTLMLQELDGNRRYSSTALNEVGAAVADTRTTARQRLARILPLAKMERLASRLERAARHLGQDDENVHRRRAPGLEQSWLWALEARVARRATGVRSAIEDAGGVYVPQRLHDVRIALKKLRYGAELLAEARCQRATADLAAFKKAQDVLGRLHDLEALAERGRDVQMSLSPPDLTAWRELGSFVHAAEDDCRPLHARYMHDRIKLLAIADRMGAAKPHAAPVTREAAG